MTGGDLETVEQAERRLRLVIDTIPALVSTTLPDGSVDFVNQRWLEFLGLPMAELLGSGWTSAVHPDDRARALDLWRTAVAAGQPSEMEMRIRRFDGEYRWMLSRDVPLRDEAGHITKWYGTCTDITDWKTAEQTARQAQRELQLIFDHAPVMISVWDASGRVQRVNTEWERNLGWTLAEAQELDTLALMYPDPDDRRGVLEFIARAERRWVDFRSQTRDGRVMETSWLRVRLPGGSSIGFGLDLTERKRADDALAQLRRREQERAEVLDQLLNRVTDGFTAIDREWRFTYINRNAERIIGRTAEEVIGALVVDAFPEAVDSPFHRAFEQAMATQEPVFLEGYLAPWDRWFENRVYPSETGLSIFFTDITDRKSAEQAALQAQRELEVIFDNIPVMISVLDASGRIQRVNREWERRLGWTMAEAKDIDVLALVYPDPEYRRKVFDFIARNERRWGDFRARNRHGRVMEISWMRFRLPDGSSIGFGLDITERKRDEEVLAQLRQGEQERAAVLGQILNRVTDGFVAIDRDWRYAYVNRNAETMMRRSADELIGQRVWEVFPHALDTAVHHAMERALAVQEPMFVEGYNPPSDRWFENRVYPSETGLSIFFTDNTDRKRAEAERERLLTSETRARTEAEAALARLRAIQSITDSALVQLGLDELLHELLSRLRQALRADRAALALVNEDGATLSPRAADGLNVQAISDIRVPFGKGITGRIAAEDRALVFNDLSNVDLTGVTPLPPPSVLPRSQAVAGAPLHIAGKVIGVVSVASDRPGHFTEEDLELLLLVADRVAPAIERARLVETAHAAHERLGALSRRLLMAQEEERRRLAGELHDELGQVLTAVKINLESLERLSSAPPVSAHLGDAIASVDHAMQTVRDLALDLRPSVLDDLGLPAALRSHLDRVARDARLEAHLSIDAVPHLATELETACFRVAQEALTNIARHARASQVWLDLHLVAGGLELRVRDDGAGFDAPAARRRALSGASMGILGMEERVSLLGGELELVTRPGAGTEVRARFPMIRNSDGSG